jgi:putative OPT family oligopeptide transporter
MSETPSTVDDGPQPLPLAAPGTPQLTIRAIITGMLLGGIMSLSNLYIALRTGWSFGVTITAGILAFAIFTALTSVGLVKRHFGVLENNAMQSVASAAGYMTGGGTVAAIPALMMITGEPMPWFIMLPWVMAIALLGVVVAVPMKRQMINHERLRFPSGIAAAETLKSLHASAAEGLDKAKALFVGGVIGGSIAFFRDATFKWIPFKWPDHVPIPGLKIAGLPAEKFTIGVDCGALMIGAGAIMGFRVAWSQLLGAFLCWFLAAPWAYQQGIITETKYKAMVGWTVWGGSSLLLTSGLLAFFMQWRTVARAFKSLSSGLGSGGDAALDPAEAVEVPMRWFLYGVAILGPLVIGLQWAFFGIAPWLGLIAVLMSFFIAVVASRATGETDTTPTGALGKLTQLTFGLLDRGNVTTNLMTANAGAGVSIHAADLLTDLKSGWLLGANPRQQFFAQFFGVTAGALFVVPAYRILVPDANAIGNDRFPAPGAQTWKNVAEMLTGGLDSLHPTAQWAMVIGGLVGITLVLLERALPRYKKFIPSAMGLGLAFTFHGWMAISMFIGATAALILQKSSPEKAERYIVPVSSGLIAGESLIGILLAVLIILGLMPQG